MTKSKAKGTKAETEVVKYLRQWWPAAERRALSGAKDKGDVAGIPGVVVEVKAAQRQLIGPWQRETFAEKKHALASACLLVVKRPRKPVAQWDAYMPADQINAALRWAGDAQELFNEGALWVRMDLFGAAVLLKAQGY
ncbi:hypothetical protein [Streptomyces sp. MP131-18]|uniref:hypothetical protein n=1 Tax=Streptomyces sp. MP131-18 TaxID=1857892 RepID=UPI00097BE91B|nr:hypothetical protein [Streptomyces sp. MP131-18]ONK10354.1 hypothetical protein STBA_10760 [Streptomyces sp. MP131-18]